MESVDSRPIGLGLAIGLLTLTRAWQLLRDVYETGHTFVTRAEFDRGQVLSLIAPIQETSGYSFWHQNVKSLSEWRN